MNCGTALVFHGTVQADVQKQMDTYVCIKDGSCSGGKDCRKLSMIGPSKEDPSLILGYVQCICPENSSFRPGRGRQVSVRVSARATRAKARAKPKKAKGAKARPARKKPGKRRRVA
jgi:hypothetical protein